jgi:hypothetical protein
MARPLMTRKELAAIRQLHDAMDDHYGVSDGKGGSYAPATRKTRKLYGALYALRELLWKDRGR